jgi:hypothetical protein
MGGRILGGVALVALVAVIGLGGTQTAIAADAPTPGTIGVFPTYTVVPSTTPGSTFTGSATFPSSAGFPAVTYTTTSTTTKSPTGESAWLGASTGFGQHFGSTRSQAYAYLSPGAGGVSTTTLTFAGAPPAGWGFALGDIDADFVEITATDTAGPIPAASLGALLNAQDTTNNPPLNYCNNSPKPSSCSGAGPFTDTPLWFPTGTTVGATTYANPIVLGHGSDTSGAYDWFLPSSTIRTLTLTYHALSGFPTYQFWLVASAPLTTITGEVAPPVGETTDPPGTMVELENPDGTPVLDIENKPVLVPVSPSGGYRFEAAEGTYELAFEVPAGFEPIAAEMINATAPTETAAPVELAADPPAVTSPAAPRLPTTGVDPFAPLTAATLLLIAGCAAVLFARRGLRSRDG